MTTAGTNPDGTNDWSKNRRFVTRYSKCPHQAYTNTGDLTEQLKADKSFFLDVFYLNKGTPPEMLCTVVRNEKVSFQNLPAEDGGSCSTDRCDLWKSYFRSIDRRSRLRRVFAPFITGLCGDLK